MYRKSKLQKKKKKVVENVRYSHTQKKAMLKGEKIYLEKERREVRIEGERKRGKRWEGGRDEGKEAHMRL